jgi:hypothetical protein
MTKEKSTWEKYQNIIMFVVLVVLAIFVGMNAFANHEVEITYSPIINSELEYLNSSEVMAQIKLNCYEMCIDKLSYSDLKLRLCLDKCEVLGQ